MAQNDTLTAAWILLSLGVGAFILNDISKKSVNSSNSQSSSPPSYSTVSKFHVDLDGAPLGISTPGGTETLVTADQLSSLDPKDDSPGISTAVLKLNPGGIREPHWHLNANEIFYCLSGTAAVTIFLGSPEVIHDSFVVTQGDIVFVPRGFFHHIENIGSIPVKIVKGFSSPRVETEGLSSAVGVSGPELLNKTFGTSLFSLLKTSTTDIGISVRSPDSPFPVLEPLPSPTVELAVPTKYSYSVQSTHSNSVTKRRNPRGFLISETNSLPTTPISVRTISRASKFKYPLEYTTPAINTSGGTDTTSDSTRFPVLKDGNLAIFSIWVNPLGIREPHWHPNTGELHYIASGTTKYFVEGPSQQIEYGQLSPGQFFWAPPSYLHYFENPDPSNRLHIVAFFTNSDPQDIGLSGGMSAYSNSVLASLFNSEKDVFSLLPRFHQDEGIIGGFRS